MIEPQIGLAPLWVRVAGQVVRRLPAGRYRAIHALCRRPPAPFWRRMPDAVGGLAFHCDLHDAIAREVCFTSCYEPQETALLRAILAPGATFVDVGANWGYHTLLAAHLVGDRGRVVSLEPDPRLFRLLAGNVRRNGLRHVTVVAEAAGDGAGPLVLAGYAETASNRGVSRITRDAAPSGLRFTVPGCALDELLDRLAVDVVDLLKMDVEGFEGVALAGLGAHLASHRVRRLLLELHPAQLAEHGDSCARVLDALRGYGYAAWRIDHSWAATRRAAYGRGAHAAGDTLRPLPPDATPNAAPNASPNASPGDAHDEWPHVLLAAPGLGPLP